ncbi:MAG: PP2C family protein-serine/threonine phosphatase [Lachnospiraceae bacterium]|nr:PP2C family protein-serine/threonine phosphatase [Lachnospiraceae bacterium]
MTEINRRRIRNGSILNQVRLPLFSFMFVILILITGLGSFLIIRLGLNASVREIDSQARMAALRVEEYKARSSLVEYWLEHRDDLDHVYDYEKLDSMERKFKALHPEFIILRDVTDEEFLSLNEEERRLYAELCLGRLSLAFSEIKDSFDPLWLFCFVMDRDSMYYMVTGTKSGEKRISEGGDIYELGVVDHVDMNDYPQLERLISDYADASEASAAEPSGLYNDDDSDLHSTGAWAPVLDDDGSLIAVCGAAMTDRMLLQAGFISANILAVVVVLAFLLMQYLVIRLLKRKVAGPIMDEETTIRSYMDTKDAAQTVSRLGEIKSANEIEALADSFSQMIEEIDRYMEEIRSITSEKERIGAELGVARQIQANMLPRSLIGYTGEPDFVILADMKPAMEVGGDFYDYFVIDDDHIGISIADVSGKGVPAALFMAVCKTLIKSAAKDDESPASIVRKVNERLCENNPDMMFVTVWVGIYTISSHEICYVNAGHENPAIYRAATGRYELILEEHDMVLGFSAEAGFREHTITMSPGDRLFVYTDGVPEATSADDELFGTSRMLMSLDSSVSGSGRDTFEALREDIAAFTNGAEQFDDITMLSFEYRGDR